MARRAASILAAQAGAGADDTDARPPGRFRESRRHVECGIPEQPDPQPSRQRAEHAAQARPEPGLQLAPRGRTGGRPGRRLRGLRRQARARSGAPDPADQLARGQRRRAVVLGRRAPGPGPGRTPHRPQPRPDRRSRGGKLRDRAAGFRHGPEPRQPAGAARRVHLPQGRPGDARSRPAGAPLRGQRELHARRDVPPGRQPGPGRRTARAAHPLAARHARGHAARAAELAADDLRAGLAADAGHDHRAKPLPGFGLGGPGRAGRAADRPGRARHAGRRAAARPGLGRGRRAVQHGRRC